MNPSDCSKELYDRVREQLRRETATGVEPPRLTAAEGVICEMLGEMAAEIKLLKERICHYERRVSNRIKNAKKSS